MRKLSWMALLCALVMGLCACGGTNPPPVSDVPDPPSASDEIQEDDSPSDEIQEDDSPSSTAPVTHTLNSFQVEVNGQLLKFPMKYSEFEELGYVAQDDTVAELPPRGSAMSEFILVKKGEFPAQVQVENDGPETIALKDSIITMFSSYESFARGGGNAKVILPDGIVLWESTIEDVLAAYGEPTKITDNASGDTLIYEFSSDEPDVSGLSYKYQFDFRDGSNMFSTFTLKVYLED